MNPEEAEKFLSLLFQLRQRGKARLLIRQAENAALDHRVRNTGGAHRVVQLRHHARAARRLSADGDPVGIAAKGRDVPFYPEQARLLIQTAEIGRCVRVFRRQLRMRQKTEHVDAIVYRHHDNAAPGQTLAVKFHLRGVAALERAAEIPDIDRELLVSRDGGGPDIQIQTVLAHRNLGIHMPFARIEILGIRTGNILHRNGSEFQAVAHSLPIFRGLRRAPAQVPDRRSRKGNSPEGGNAGIGRRHSAHQPVFCFGNSEHDSASSFSLFYQSTLTRIVTWLRAGFTSRSADKSKRGRPCKSKWTRRMPAQRTRLVGSVSP